MLTTSDHIDKEVADVRASGKQVVAMLECASGNAEVGTAWIETAVFGHETTLAEVIGWARYVGGQTPGRLMLSLDARDGSR